MEVLYQILDWIGTAVWWVLMVILLFVCLLVFAILGLFGLYHVGLEGYSERKPTKHR